jgi:acetyl-CoA acyltransferase
MVRDNMDNRTKYPGIIEGLSRFRPIFRINGTVTVGNSSQMSDDAAAVVIIFGEKVNSGESKE